MGVAKWLNSAISGKAPQLAFTDLHKNRRPGVSWPDKQKSLEMQFEKRNRKPAILDLVAILAVFYSFTLTYLSPGFHQINFILRWVSSQQDGDINYLEFQFRGSLVLQEVNCYPSRIPPPPPSAA